jgi:hypothetical protein
VLDGEENNDAMIVKFEKGDSARWLGVVEQIVRLEMHGTLPIKTSKIKYFQDDE